MHGSKLGARLLGAQASCLLMSAQREQRVD